MSHLPKLLNINTLQNTWRKQASRSSTTIVCL